MYKSQYDAVITDMGDSGFTGYYKRGKYLKLSDGVTVITIWKPLSCPYEYRNNEVYKDAVIQISGKATNIFTYQDIIKVGQTIEMAIDYLNQEKENLIDRDKIADYEHVPAPISKTSKTNAIKYADLQVGGIYADDKKKKWIFLGKGTLLEEGEQNNRSNDGYNYSEYVYMEYPENLEKIGNNEFKTDYFTHPDTYASKKRFFEKVGQLPLDSQDIIIIHCGRREYRMCNGVKPKTIMELFNEENRRGL